MDDLPPVPELPFLPTSAEDRARMVRWATDYAALAVREAVERERERCARICDNIEHAADDQWDLTKDPSSQGESIGAVKCAAAIREGQFGMSSCDTPEYKQEQADKNAKARALLDAAIRP